MDARQPIDINTAFDGLTFLPDRTPNTEDTTEASWADELTDYRDGGMYIVHYAGETDWECHRSGDEIVIVIEGSTTMTMIIDGADHHQTLGPMQMVIVPQGVWHRFSTPDGVKVMTVTPQPTDHHRPG